MIDAKSTKNTEENNFPHNKNVENFFSKTWCKVHLWESGKNQKVPNLSKFYEQKRSTIALKTKINVENFKQDGFIVFNTTKTHSKTTK